MQKEHYLLKADTTISFWQSDFNVFIYSVSLTVNMSSSFFFSFFPRAIWPRGQQNLQWMQMFHNVGTHFIVNLPAHVHLSVFEMLCIYTLGNLNVIYSWQVSDIFFAEQFGRNLILRFGDIQWLSRSTVNYFLCGYLRESVHSGKTCIAAEVKQSIQRDCIHSSLYAKRRCVWIKRDKVHKCSLPGDHLRKVIHKS